MEVVLLCVPLDHKHQHLFRLDINPTRVNADYWGGGQITATPIYPLKSDYCFNLVADSKQAAVKLFDCLSGTDWRQASQNFIYPLIKLAHLFIISNHKTNTKHSLIPASQTWILAADIDCKWL